MTTIAQRKLADNILKSLEKNRTKPKPMHLVVQEVEEEQAAQNKASDTDDSVIFIRSNFEP